MLNISVFDFLCIRPGNQRKGPGGALLKHGLEVVDRDGKKAYLESSKNGFGLYLKYGWNEVHELRVDTAPLDEEGMELNMFMIRDPQSVEL